LDGGTKKLSHILTPVLILIPIYFCGMSRGFVPLMVVAPQDDFCSCLPTRKTVPIDHVFYNSFFTLGGIWRELAPSAVVVVEPLVW